MIRYCRLCRKETEHSVEKKEDTFAGRDLDVCNICGTIFIEEREKGITLFCTQCGKKTPHEEISVDSEWCQYDRIYECLTCGKVYEEERDVQ